MTGFIDENLTFTIHNLIIIQISALLQQLTKTSVSFSWRKMKTFVPKSWNSKEEIEFYIGNLFNKVRDSFLIFVWDWLVHHHLYIL